MVPPLRRQFALAEPQGPSYQPDIAQFAELAGALARGEIPLGDVIDALDNRNVPPQLRQVVYMKNIASAADNPQILIPTNKNRMSFILSFIDSQLAIPSIVLFTYGPRPAPNIGIPLLSVNPYGESNGTISIDDIWVHPLNNTNNATNYPATVVAYEGSLAIESHLHKQTAEL